MSKIKTIFFDLDETLIENKLSVTEVFKQTFEDFTSELGASNKAAFFTQLSKCAKMVWEQMFTVETSPERQIIQCFEESIAATCLLYTSPSPRDLSTSRMPSSA